ncbi:MAG: hypothetical protein ACREJV_02975 [Candidatus Rokuibacteriota bacterium]
MIEVRRLRPQIGAEVRGVASPPSIAPGSTTTSSGSPSSGISHYADLAWPLVTDFLRRRV